MVHLAQVNAAILRFPLDDARLAGFVAAVEQINQLAQEAPGFVWRHPDAHRHLHSPQDDVNAAVTVVNLSVWQSYQHLHNFTYRSIHGQLVRRRGQWFTTSRGPTTALWWIRDDEQPDPVAALARLRHLRRYGPTPQAFTVRRRFDSRGRPEPRTPSPA
jgi:uncharacterized protein DUF3291